VFNSIISFANNFDVSNIFTAAGDLANVVAMYLSPTLLMLAIYSRILGDSLDTFTTNGAGVWSRAVRDFVVWGVVLGSYFAIGSLVANFANVIYHWCDCVGGLSLLAHDMGEVAKFIEAKLQNEKTSGTLVGTLVKGYVTGGGTLTFITGICYYVSLLIVSFLVIALKIAHALAFGLAFIWGLIAIPVSVSKGIKLLRGWALFMGFALVWPLIQALLVALIRPSFIKALNKIMTENSNVGVDMISSDLTMTVLNLVFAATVVAAPYVASSLVANMPAAAGMVTPFISAAMTGVAGVAGAIGGIKSAGSKILGSGSSRALAAKAAAKKATGSDDWHKAMGLDGSGTSKTSKASSDVAPGEVPQQGSAPGAGATTGGPGDTSEAKQKQQRRGAIVRNLRKNK
jgi:hypothetical protein